jgi:hypothetical protein
MGSMRYARGPDDAARSGFPDGEILDCAHVEAAGDRPPKCEHGGAARDRLLAERRNLQPPEGRQEFRPMGPLVGLNPAELGQNYPVFGDRSMP